MAAITDCPGAYRLTQGPKLDPMKKFPYCNSLSFSRSNFVAPTLMTLGEFPGEYLQAS